MNRYILDGKTPVRCDDLATWAKWLGKAERHVAKSGDPDKVWVSTVFLGLDHNYFGAGGQPILFETMIFGGEHDQHQTRCSTWTEAEKMHKNACALAGINVNV